jgi:hypothetical protein
MSNGDGDRSNTSPTRSELELSPTSKAGAISVSPKLFKP